MYMDMEESLCICSMSAQKIFLLIYGLEMTARPPYCDCAVPHGAAWHAQDSAWARLRACMPEPMPRHAEAGMQRGWDADEGRSTEAARVYEPRCPYVAVGRDRLKVGRDRRSCMPGARLSPSAGSEGIPATSVAGRFVSVVDMEPRAVFRILTGLGLLANSC
eukprot:jgi/Ulvmu1/5498/UM023_0034.1